MSNRILAAAIAAAIAFPVAALPAFADEASPSDLDQVLVTATRTEVALDASLVPAQVITREEIERTQVRSLPELLRGRAGINIGNSGGLGKLSTVSIRGSESDHVLVLVDGVRVGSATSGLVGFQDFPVDQIDRIEIVRGPRSSLYGSEAIGGVIQIFTRRDQGPVKVNGRVGIGSDNLREGSFGVGRSTGRGWFGADVAYQETDGINACNGSSTLFQGCFTEEPDRDGYENRSASLRGGFELTDTLAIEGRALRAEGTNEYDGDFANESDTVQQAVGGKLAWTPSDAVKVSVDIGRANDKSDDFHDGDASGNFDTRRDTSSVQADFTLAPNQILTVGGDYQKDVVESTTGFDADSRDNTAGFAEYQGRFGINQLQASVRRDDNEQFGSHTTGSLGWGLLLDGGYRVTASYATGFKAPTFNDLYYPGFSNPDLEPEESKSLNIGVAQYADAYTWTFNVYENRIDQLISYDSNSELDNIEEARIRGAEFTFNTRLADYDLGVQLSHTDPRNDSPGFNEDNLLARRSRNTGRIDIDRAFGAFRIGATLNGASHRYDNAANTIRLGGYATFDLRASYALTPEWTLEAKAANAFDKDYETVAWYNQTGRVYGLAVRYQGK